MYTPDFQIKLLEALLWIICTNIIGLVKGKTSSLALNMQFETLQMQSGDFIGALVKQWVKIEVEISEV